jgi:hypothetical protein
MAGVHRICDYMLAANHFTHQLPRAANECKPHLLAQHPQLAEVQAPERFEDEAHVWRWLAEQVDRYGTELLVRPVPETVDRDPIEELIELRGGDAHGIIAIEVPGRPDEDASI